jgi:hypothetical protein
VDYMQLQIRCCGPNKFLYGGSYTDVYQQFGRNYSDTSMEVRSFSSSALFSGVGLVMTELMT